MNRSNLSRGVRIGLGAFLAVILSVFQPLGAQDVQGVIEVQTRGPLHEAFAELVEMSTTPSIIVPKQAPDPINEIPPDVKPEGDVVWIPGYWAWDDERDDFLWVSGVWRVPPPGATWVPGYWAAVQGGFQWVPGFWTTEAELTYLPPPPQSLDRGPTSPPPGDNFFYIPGSWVLIDGRYAWQPGFWAAYQPGWVWVNTRYVWTPSGYCHIAGRWDYPLNQRGYCFAPAYFRGQSYSQPGFAYRPSIILNTTLLTTMLFARPSYGSYYFGDYYAPTYAQAGFQPWYNYRYAGSTPNSLYAYERWSNRLRDPNWEARIRGEFDRRTVDESARPPRDWSRWQERNRDPAITQAEASNSPFVSVEQAVSQIVNDRRWIARPAEDRDSGEARWREIRALQEQRRQTELQARTNAAADTQSGAQVATDPKRVDIKPSLKLRVPASAKQDSVSRPIDRRGNEPKVGTSSVDPRPADSVDRPGRSPNQSPPLTTTLPGTTPPATTPPATTSPGTTRPSTTPPSTPPATTPPATILPPPKQPPTTTTPGTQPPKTSQPATVPPSTSPPKGTQPPGLQPRSPMVNPPSSQPLQRDDRPGRPDRRGSADPSKTPPSSAPRVNVPGIAPVVPPTTQQPSSQPPQVKRPQTQAPQGKNPTVRPPNTVQSPTGKQPSKAQPQVPKQPTTPSPAQPPKQQPNPPPRDEKKPRP